MILDRYCDVKTLSNRLMKRIQSNYRFIVGFNSGLIVLGVTGVHPANHIGTFTQYFNSGNWAEEYEESSVRQNNLMIALNVGGDSLNHAPYRWIKRQNS